MRWLQWSKYDLKKGIGGAEVHARSLAYELQKRGVDAAISNKVEDLVDSKWDVIHTHGSSSLPFGLKVNPRSLLVHTLHGTTFGRMTACREWTWPGGYLAGAREIYACNRANVVLSVREDLSLLEWTRRRGKKTAVCGNGWDSASSGGAEGVLDAPLLEKLKSKQPFWVFIGRGGDPVKGASRAALAFQLSPGQTLVAAPGEGFEERTDIIKTGPLSPTQVQSLLKLSSGLLISSFYEGNSLVVLEALAQGIPVVSTPVGAAPELSKRAQGIIITNHQPQAIANAIHEANRRFQEPSLRSDRAKHNQVELPTWGDVADTCLAAIK